MKIFRDKNCSRCAQRFVCGAETGEHCWCASLPQIPFIAEERQDCLCPGCLSVVIQEAERTAALSDKNLQPVIEGPRQTDCLREGEDYYLEDGALVFTARYHLRRGYCCENGCRHCPYT